jgi:hypothetical protein
VNRRAALGLLAAAAALPRLLVLLYERSDITSANVDKGDAFARTFVASGTYGFIPDHPSAYTQPLYGFFLIPFYWALERHWLVVGLAQVAVAVATAWLVYVLARRVVSAGAALIAALIATLHPYLIWHDAHMNREILDHFLAAALVLATLVAVERRSALIAAAAGAVAGAAILGNVRLIFVPVVLAGFLLWRNRRPTWPAALALVGASALVLAPWLLRNERSVGCVALTTDSRALWKANNVNTLETLRAGKWIDDVPAIPGAPPTPNEAGALYEQTGRILETDECAQMRFYRARAIDSIEDHPGEKTVLAFRGAAMLWQPWVTKTEGRAGAGTWQDVGRDWIEGAFAVALFAAGAYGLMLVPRPFAVLVVLLLAYQTLAAMLFVGETRYRAPWDFLIAICAAVALLQLAGRFAPSLRARLARA